MKKTTLAPVKQVKHTSGPWYVAGYGVLGPKAKLSDAICTTGTDRHVDERLANARLIAAAPDLLEMVHVMANVECLCLNNKIECEEGCPRNDARALIARVDGV